jgi:hypothetical protein
MNIDVKSFDFGLLAGVTVMLMVCLARLVAMAGRRRGSLPGEI